MSDAVKTNALPSGEWGADRADAYSANDLTVRNCDVVRLERMANGDYWMGVYVGEKVIHIDISSDSHITAFVRGVDVLK